MKTIKWGDAIEKLGLGVRGSARATLGRVTLHQRDEYQRMDPGQRGDRVAGMSWAPEAEPPSKQDGP